MCRAAGGESRSPWMRLQAGLARQSPGRTWPQCRDAEIAAESWADSLLARALSLADWPCALGALRWPERYRHVCWCWPQAQRRVSRSGVESRLPRNASRCADHQTTLSPCHRGVATPMRGSNPEARPRGRCSTRQAILGLDWHGLAPLAAGLESRHREPTATSAFPAAYWLPQRQTDRCPGRTRQTPRNHRGRSGSCW